MRAVSPALALVAVTTAVAGCGGTAATSTRQQDGGDAGHPAITALRAAPASVSAACRGIAGTRVVSVLCPTRLPDGRWSVNHRSLRNGRCAFLLDLDTRPFGENEPFHALAGGRCAAWPLAIRADHWPADPTLADDLGLIGHEPLRPGQPSTTPATPVPPRVLRRVAIAGHPGLLLRETDYPTGGVHGGHIAAIWNQGRHGYVLSLHFMGRGATSSPRWRQMVIDTAGAMSRSRVRP
jgi:hypothetical protein